MDGHVQTHLFPSGCINNHRGNYERVIYHSYLTLLSHNICFVVVPCSLDYKVYMPKANITYLTWTHAFEWYVVQCVSKKWIQNRHVFPKE